jgi:hypothetical protein
METEENNKKNLKLSPKHFVLKAGRNMVDKIKNFGKQVAENYKNGFTYVSDRPSREANGGLQDKLDKMAEASFENSLRMSGMNEEAIKNIEQKIANVETKMYDFFDKGIGKLDKLVDKWNDYIENTKNEKKGVEDGKDER